MSLLLVVCERTMASHVEVKDNGRFERGKTIVGQAVCHELTAVDNSGQDHAMMTAKALCTEEARSVCRGANR